MVKPPVRRAGLLLILAMAAALTPRSADAAIYIWNVDASGSWTTPGNWLYAGGGAANPWGYPSAAGDQAFFTGEYTAARTITIPANVAVTVGTVYFAAAVPATVTGASTSRLVFDNGSAVAQVVTTSSATFSLNVVMNLRSALLTTVDQGGTLNLDRMIEDGGVRSLTKRGPGTVGLRQTNAYTGVTRLERGRLSANAPGGSSVLGNLEIGTGVASSSAIAHFNGPTQLNTAATIDVRAGGVLELEGPQRAGRVRVTDGSVGVVDPDATVAELTMTGGVFEALYPFRLPGVVTATSSATGPAVMRPYAQAVLTVGPYLIGATTFAVADGPGAVDFNFAVPVLGGGEVVKTGAGTMRFTGNLSSTSIGVTTVREGVVELARDDGVAAVAGPLYVGGGTTPARVVLLGNENLHDTQSLTINDLGTFVGSQRRETVGVLSVTGSGVVLLDGNATLNTLALSMLGGRISLPAATGRLVVNTLSGSSTASVAAGSTASASAVIDGAGALVITDGTRPLYVVDGPQLIDMQMGVDLLSVSATGLIKRGPGVVRFEKTSAVDMTVEDGRLLVSGAFGHAVTTSGNGVLGGTGTVGAVTTTTGGVAPGFSPGRLTTGPLELGGTYYVELNGATPGSGHDQIDVRGSVRLNNAVLAVTVGFTPAADASFTIIANDGTDPVTGAFGNLAEGATITVGSRMFAVTYRGGDGNDIVLTTATPMTYYLAEGATGAFFDDDVLLANPTDREAPVTLTFLKEGGSTVVTHHIVPPMSRLTVSVDQISGLESTSASVKVVSDARVPLVVERTMFWDQSRYGGHTANAVAQPETRWIFAEGFQGFFDTYILIANPAATPTTATLTFLREGAAPFVATVPVDAFARKTVYAGDYPELRERAFGIVVEAVQPVIAERSMYFSSQPGRLWAGGHVNTGIRTPSRSWFHAEGATGGYFNTFILLSNPQDTDAHVELRFLLSTGEVITRQKTLRAQQRLTVNPAAEDDVRLLNAAVSTVVDADVPIISERSMYWPGETGALGEGHNSTGVASLATRWGLAEGRLGGANAFDTFILLANPSSEAAEVTITYLRDTGAPIVRRHTVPATSRFNVDVKTSVPELQDTSFGARIEVTNATPIAVERSLYWNANGAFWAGGTNALATPLP